MILLVVNFIDDDGNGIIDLCDMFDIVVLVFVNYVNFLGLMYVFDGVMGVVYWSIDVIFDVLFMFVLGDIDGDGFFEIVVVVYGVNFFMVFEYDGIMVW